MTLLDTSPLPIVAGRWALDPTHSTVGFTIRNLGVKVRGRFTAFDAELVVGATPETTTVTATIDLASFDTDNARRDDHVRSPQLLDVARRPTMTFSSTRVDGRGSEWTLQGDLAIGDVVRRVTLAIDLGGVQSFGGIRHASFEARGAVRRKEFGLGFGPIGVILGDVVKVELDLRFVEPR